METSVFHWYKFKGGLPIQKTSKQTLRISNVLEHLKSTKITMDDVYQKLLVVMKHGYIILNLRGKLITRCMAKRHVINSKMMPKSK